MRTFDITGCTLRTTTIVNQDIDEPVYDLRPVRAVFSINDGDVEVETHKIRVYENGVLDYAQMLDCIATPRLKQDLKVTPETIHKGICGEYHYAVEPLKIVITDIIMM